LAACFGGLPHFLEEVMLLIVGQIIGVKEQSMDCREELEVLGKYAQDKSYNHESFRFFRYNVLSIFEEIQGKRT